MRFFSIKLNDLEDLWVLLLEELYDHEQQILKALPQMIKAAHSDALRSAFEQHLEETKQQSNRLETLFQQLGREPKRETSHAMKGLVEECQQIISAKGDASVADAALIIGAQRVEHLEIAGYGSAAALARRLGHISAAMLLEETLEEEKVCDHKLTKLAEVTVNEEAHKA